MKQRAITLFLVLGCAAFGAAGFFTYAAGDRNAPEIKVEKRDISYTEGEAYDALLAGVTAKDDVDGEITDRVFVDRVVDMGNGKAVVYYGVLDAGNNVGTAKRTVTYTALEKEADADGEDAEGTDGAEEEAQDKKAEESADEKDTEEKTDKEKEKADKDKEDKDKEDKDKKEADAGEELKPNGASPAIALTKKKATIKKGETFDKLSVVKDAVDDKDDRSTLYQHIHADGQVDTNRAGTYKITYYVTDSDGNASEAQVFTLKVE